MAVGPRRWSLLRREIIRASDDHAAIDLATVLNTVLDAIPRIEIRLSGRPRPAFRTCGVVGFAVAVLVAVSGALLGERSLPALAQAIGVAVLTFFGYTHLRKAITGVERLVLLEHVWVALAAVSALLAVQGLAVTATLDPFCAGLAFFLAGGRTGCLLVGCCHGHPSRLGIRYPEGHASDGFAAWLVGVRLFPVQLLELIGLVVIGMTTFAIAVMAAPGRATVWYLFSYALLRFTLEEIRGDERPHFLDMSVPRWMCVGEFLFTLAVVQSSGWLPIGVVVCGLALYLGRDPERRLLDPGHVSEVRGMLERFRGADRPDGVALAWSTSRHVTVAISPMTEEQWWPGEAFRVSLCLPSRRENVRLACQLAAEAFPTLDPDRALFGGSNTLHFLLPDANRPAVANSRQVFQQLYRALLTNGGAAVVPSPSADPRLSLALAPASTSSPAPSPPPVPWYWRAS